MEAIAVKDWGHNGLACLACTSLTLQTGVPRGSTRASVLPNGVWWMAGEVGPRLGPSAKYKWPAGSGFDANVPPALRRRLTINYSHAKSDIMASKIIQYGQLSGTEKLKASDLDVGSLGARLYVHTAAVSTRHRATETPTKRAQTPDAAH